MAIHTKSKGSKWEKLPFSIGREGPEYLPSSFDDKRTNGPKTVPTGSLKQGEGGSGTRTKKKKSVPKKIY